MLRVMISIFLSVVVFASAHASVFKKKVELSDLAALSQRDLDTFKDVEFKIFLMKVAHARAEELEDKAKADLRTSKLTLDAKKQRLKSLEADLKEANAAQDTSQVDATKEALIKARKELDRAKLLILWKEQEIEVQVAGIRIAKLAVQLAEMERDLAWISKLKERNLEAGQKYDLADLQKRLGKKQKAYQTDVTQKAVAIETARKLKAAYEKASP